MGSQIQHLMHGNSNDFLTSKVYKKSVKDFEALGISNDEIVKLFKLYRRLDVDDSGKVNEYSWRT